MKPKNKRYFWDSTFNRISASFHFAHSKRWNVVTLSPHSLVVFHEAARLPYPGVFTTSVPSLFSPWTSHGTVTPIRTNYRPSWQTGNSASPSLRLSVGEVWTTLFMLEGELQMSSGFLFKKTAKQSGEASAGMAVHNYCETGTKLEGKTLEFLVSIPTLSDDQRSEQICCSFRKR